MQMIFHQIAGDPAQGFLCRRDLHDDVGAVAVFGDHFLQAADLAFNAAKAFLVAEFQLRVDGDCFMAGADHAGAIGGGRMSSDFVGHSLIPSPGIYTPTPYRVSNADLCRRTADYGQAGRGWYNAGMTLL